ncbi:MAG: aromatic aminobenezylarsenical efflux permease ArsG family transporter [Planctomycetota bacterium]|nr:aromatic aminobenezylarsenical efflux permease ArsG family transporter [Planctomycetota bacterium]
MSFSVVSCKLCWFGPVTAVSPCPLATNIAAISFLSRNVSKTRRVMLSAALYTLGRTLVYVTLGVILLWAFQKATGNTGNLQEYASSTSRSLQHYGYIALGPALLFIGMILLGLFEFNLSFGVGGSKLQERIAEGGAIWALPLGILFAFAFCPPSVALFLSALVISLEHESMVLPPLVYGIGTAVPVIVFAIFIAFASQYVGKAFNAMTKIEKWFRLITGLIFVLYWHLLYADRVLRGTSSSEKRERQQHSQGHLKKSVSSENERGKGRRGRQGVSTQVIALAILKEEIADDEARAGHPSYSVLMVAGDRYHRHPPSACFIMVVLLRTDTHK